MVAFVVAAAILNPTGVPQTQNATVVPLAKPRAIVMFSHPLPRLNGAQLNTTVLEVNYGPGESSMPHTYPCAVIGYVTSGSIRTQVEGQPETVIKTGGSFYEQPKGVHLVSANASLTEPASFLAFFVCDHAAPLSAELSSIATQGGGHR